MASTLPTVQFSPHDGPPHRLYCQADRLSNSPPFLPGRLFKLTLPARLPKATRVVRRTRPRSPMTDDPHMKTCNKCKGTKPPSDFHRNKRTKDGLEYACRSCTSVARKAEYARDPRGAIAKTRRWVELNPERSRQGLHRGRMRRYGLTPESYVELFDAQGGVCAICGAKPRMQRFPVDHDHSCCSGTKDSCGECIRGILCVPCNVTLGRFERYRDEFITYIDKAKEA